MAYNALGGVTRTSKRMSRTFSWRSAPWDTSQHARLDLLEGPHTLGDVLEDVRLVLAAPSTRFCDSRPHLELLCQIAGGCLGSWWPTPLS